MKKKYIVIAAIVAVVVAGIFLYLFIGKKGNSDKAGENFTVKKGNVTYFTEQTGIIKAQVGAIVNVGTRATGTLVYLPYQVGSSVKKGELIARIDDREIVANIRNAEALVEEANRDLDAKRAQQLYSKTNYDREKNLLDQEFTTRDSVDQAKRELDVATAQVELGKAKIKEAAEKLGALKVSLSYTKIYAPISGYVSAVSTQLGETVVSGLSAAIPANIFCMQSNGRQKAQKGSSCCRLDNIFILIRHMPIRIWVGGRRQASNSTTPPTGSLAQQRVNHLHFI